MRLEELTTELVSNKKYKIKKAELLNSAFFMFLSRPEISLHNLDLFYELKNLKVSNNHFFKILKLFFKLFFSTERIYKPLAKELTLFVIV